MQNYLFYIIIVIVSFDFLLDRILNYLNTRHSSMELPEELKDVYDAGQYRKQQEYKKANDKLAFVTAVISFAIIILMIVFGGFNRVDLWARHFSSNPVIVALIFFGILGVASGLINLPFSIYDTFVIEERFGFNRTTIRTFILDKVKGMLLSAVIGGGLLAIFIWFYMLTGQSFWIYAWIVATIFSVFMAFFYSSIIVPLFNKQTPLQEGELRQAIDDLSNKAGFSLENIYVIDSSKRSAKSNAYFTGFGAKKRIVLYDTLINDLTTEGIVAVLAHEIGHYRKKHVITGLITGILNTGLILFVLSLFIDNPALSQALGSSNPSFHLGLLAFGILYSPFSLVLGLFLNRFSRKHEYAADNYVKAYNLHDQLIEALKKLSSKNLSNLTPHPAYVFFYYSHPTLLQRIRALKSGSN